MISFAKLDIFSFMIVCQERNTLAKYVIEGSDMNAKKLVAETGKPGSVLNFKTENIELLGIKLHKNKSAQPENVNLTSEDEGVEFLWVDGIKQATVVKYSSIKDILSPEELQKSVDSTIQASGNLTIQSTIISFATTPKLPNVTQRIKIVLKNNQVCVEFATV